MLENDYIYGMVTDHMFRRRFKNLTGEKCKDGRQAFEVTLIHTPKNTLELLNEIMGALLNAVDNTDLVDSFKTDRIVIERRKISVDSGRGIREVNTGNLYRKQEESDSHPAGSHET